MSKAKVALFLVIFGIISFLSVEKVRLTGEVNTLKATVESLEKNLRDEQQKLSECRQSKESVEAVCKLTEKELSDLKKSQQKREKDLLSDISKLEEILDGQKLVVKDTTGVLPPDLARLLEDSCQRSNQGSPCPTP